MMVAPPVRGVTWPGTPRPCCFTPHPHPTEQGQRPLFAEEDTGLGRSKDLPGVTRREGCGVRMCEPGTLNLEAYGPFRPCSHRRRPRGTRELEGPVQAALSGHDQVCPGGTCVF